MEEIPSLSHSSLKYKHFGKPFGSVHLIQTYPTKYPFDTAEKFHTTILSTYLRTCVFLPDRQVLNNIILRNYQTEVHTHSIHSRNAIDQFRCISSFYTGIKSWKQSSTKSVVCFKSRYNESQRGSSSSWWWIGVGSLDSWQHLISEYHVCVDFCDDSLFIFFLN